MIPQTIFYYTLRIRWKMIEFKRRFQFHATGSMAIWLDGTRRKYDQDGHEVIMIWDEWKNKWLPVKPFSGRR